MQKTEVFDIFNTILGPILAIFGPIKWGQFLWADFFLQKMIGAMLLARFGASLMQKTEVLISLTPFWGPIWPFLAILLPKKWVQFFWAHFLAKNRLGPYSREDLGLV
jgi:hypothetical protein